MLALRTMAIVTVTLWALACGSSDPPSSPPPGNPGGQSITGRERIGWDQSAPSAAEVNALRFAIYVDGARSVLTEVRCTSTADVVTFACSALLPRMSTGTHSLEIASFTEQGTIVESAKSAPLLVTVTGADAPAQPLPLAPGEQLATVDGVQLVAERLATELRNPTDIAVARDGRVFLTDATGRITVIEDGQARELLHLAEAESRGGILALTLSPDFQRSGHAFVVAPFASDAGNVFRVLRYQLQSEGAVDRVILLPDVPASRNPAAAIRFGPDGKLYAAFDSADRADLAAQLSAWSGKILRLEADGRTPADQPAASPVLWSGVQVPRGLDWSADGTLWAAEDGTDGVERLRAIAVAGGVRRPAQRGSYALPRPFAGRSVAAYTHTAIPEFSGNLFLAGDEAAYLLRITFDRQDRGRALTTERLLDGKVTAVRAVAAGHDGALYFCTADEAWRLTSAPLPGRGPR